MTRVFLSVWGRSLAAALIVSVSLMTAACAQGDKAAPVPKKDKAAAQPAAKIWEDAPGYDVFLGTVEDEDARVLQSPDFQKLLILPGKGDAVWLLTLKTKEASAFARTDVTVNPDGGFVSPSAVMKPVGAVTQKGAELSFSAGGSSVRLAPEPPLIGEIKLADLLKKKKDYAAAASQYRPNGAAISLLKSVQRPVEVVVFFGTWCHFCKKHLPRLVKSVEVAANPNITVRFVGINEDLTEPEALISKYAVSKTPTMIAWAGGGEIGRIVEEPTKSVEEDLALLLLGGR